MKKKILLQEYSQETSSGQLGQFCTPKFPLAFKSLTSRTILKK